VIVSLRLPRYTIAKPLSEGTTGFYFTIPTRYRKLGCEIPNEPLGNDYSVACGPDGNSGRAAVLNGLFDEWWRAKNGQPVESISRYGTVDWLFREYKASDGYLERVAPRSRPDYERTMLLLADTVTKQGDRIGTRSVRSITPLSSEKLYNRVIKGSKGLRLRQGEKLVILCRRAWSVVQRLHPNAFNKDVPNPWTGVTMKRRIKKTKAAVDRETVYEFAWKAIEVGYPEPAAAAVICFEWLQRPENVLAGCITWNDYRGNEVPTAIKVEHHKTGVVLWHPLEESTDEGVIQFYADAEAVLGRLPRRGVPLILKQRRRGGTDPYRPNHMAKLVRRLADGFGLPATFTLDACRHGGMTELEEAALTTGQGKALSGHKTDRSYGGYAKLTMERALPATRKRYAHRLANEQGASIQNDGKNAVQNETKSDDAAIA
jgi:hypothetical protein